MPAPTTRVGLSTTMLGIPAAQVLSLALPRAASFGGVLLPLRSSGGAMFCERRSSRGGVRLVSGALVDDLPTLPCSPCCAVVPSLTSFRRDDATDDARDALFLTKPGDALFLTRPGDFLASGVKVTSGSGLPIIANG